ncbi:MAG: helix-turn-helix domain-containing protein [Planctomycetes bacterium]|nr:helix-turn-helix domain-containing protein [Planctomycetota bacterium]
MLTVKLAAERATVSESLIYAWCKSGLLPHVRLGRPGKRGTIRIDEDEFDNFLQTMKVSEMPQDEGEFRHIR